MATGHTHINKPTCRLQNKHEEALHAEQVHVQNVFVNQQTRQVLYTSPAFKKDIDTKLLTPILNILCLDQRLAAAPLTCFLVIYVLSHVRHSAVCSARRCSSQRGITY